jgi:L-malate glycosyltransferase
VRRELGLADDDVVVGNIAVFRTQKALPDWLQMAAAVHKAHPRARFVLVGDGPERERVVELATRLRLMEVLRLPGLRTDVADVLAALDIFCLSSVFEGLPLALLEAMAASLPVVATRVGGVPEATGADAQGDSEAALLVPAKSPEALANAVGALLNDPARRVALGAAGRRRCASHHSMTRMQERLVAVYQSVLR